MLGFRAFCLNYGNSPWLDCISKKFFSSAGDVKEVRLAVDGEGQFRGFGHVEFFSEDAANKV
jgi:nucleolin